MPCYVNYTEDGRIVGCVKCESDVPTVKSEGILSMEVNEEAHDEVVAQLGTDAFYVQNEELIPSPAKPSPHHEWDWPTKSWLPNLDAAREAKRQAWNAWRDRDLIAGYTHNGHVFHSDDRFMAELQLILKGYEREYLTGTSAIRTRDNGTLQMMHIEIEELLLLIGIHRQAIYAQSWAGKDLLEGLTTLESIMAGGPPS